MTGAMWSVPREALENSYARFWSSQERKEYPDNLCFFLFGVLPSVRISFTICEIEITVPAS